jgi:hypothetical protein
MRDLIANGLKLGAAFYQRGEMAGATSALYVATVQAFALTHADPTYARSAHFVFRCAVLATMGGPEPMAPAARSALLRTLKAAAAMAPEAGSVGLAQLQTAWRAALISLELEGPCKPEP